MRKKKNRCVEYIKRFDADKLKPFLIHKYDKDQHKMARKLNDLLMNKGD